MSKKSVAAFAGFVTAIIFSLYLIGDISVIFSLPTKWLLPLAIHFTEVLLAIVIVTALTIAAVSIAKAVKY